MHTIYNQVAAVGGWLLSVLFVSSSGAGADSIDLIETSYEVNVSGITVLDVKYRADISAAGYQSQASVKTRGVVTFFSDYRMDVAASGSFLGGQASPSRYTYRREKNDKIKAVEFTWSDGHLSNRNRHASKNPDADAEIDVALTPNVADPLTAIFRMGVPSRGNVCKATQRIFDGRDVFDLRFSFKREVVLDANSPGAYHGKAYECHMTYVPVAGRDARKFRKSKEAPPTYTVWFAPVRADVSGRLLLVPVRAIGRLKGLKFVAYARRARIDGRPFNEVSLSAD